MSNQTVTAYNRTDTPVAIDGQGHLLGGNEYAPVNLNTREAQIAVNRGALAIIDDPGDLDGVQEAAADAIRATRQANGQPADQPHSTKAQRAAAANAKSGEGDSDKGA